MLTICQCFYINLPIGGLAAIIVFFFLPSSALPRPAPATWKEKVLQLDPVGAMLLLGLIVSFILALQYGGQTYSWHSSVVIGLLVGSVLLFVVFIVWEVYQKERAMVVPRLVCYTPCLAFAA